MCGFCGFWEAKVTGDSDGLAATAQRMADTLAHRGPDDQGVWVDGDHGLGLGHRRLSIIDLSPLGHQPMPSHDGAWVIVYNGEIYNYQELRAALEAAFPELAGAWRGSSDTEVMLEGFARWGVAATLERANGMFALAAWNRRDGSLWLARDRMGEKPLYYGVMNGVLLFGSEIKALAAHPAFRGRIHRGALKLFMRHNYVPGPWSIYEGVHKLPPAHYLRLGAPGEAATPRAYWDIARAAREGAARPFTDAAEVEEGLHDLLRDAVGSRMVADVPLGAFLSGGIDSSTVVALMQAQSSRPVKTFSIGFTEQIYDEAPFARRVAQHLGTEHTELYVTPAEALAVVPDLPRLWDEPFSDSSQIPTHLVSRLARRSVTVSLSGDGGDELLAGYDRYQLGRQLWSRIGWLPAPLRCLGAGVMGLVPAGLAGRAIKAASAVLPDDLAGRPPAQVARRVRGLLATPHDRAMYRDLVSHWKDAEELVPGVGAPDYPLGDPGAPGLGDGLVGRMSYWDMLTYLPDDILVKLDRAAMGVSLEGRVPLLDHRVVEFSFRVPTALKLAGGRGKLPLRAVLHRYVPPALVERPKKGFGVPIDHWLRGPLKDWAWELIRPERLGREGHLNPAAVTAKWDEHQAGVRDWHFYLWDVLMFQSWLETARA